MKRYRKCIKPYLGAFILDPLLMLTEMAKEIMLPKLMPMIINNEMVRRNMQCILPVGKLMILAILAMTIGGIGDAYFSVKTAVSFTGDLRDNLLSKMQEFSFKGINPHNADSLVICLTNDIQRIQNVLMMGLRMTTRAPGTFIGALIMVFVMNTRLVMVILVITPLLITTIVVILKTAFPRFTTMQKELDQPNSGTQETLTNVRVIKSPMQEEFEGEKFRDMSQDLKNSSLDAMKIVIITMPVMTLAVGITTLAVVWYGGNIIITRDMSAGDLTVSTTYIMQIFTSLTAPSMVFLQLSRTVASIRRTGEVMDTEIDLMDRDASRRDLAVLKGKMEFKYVSFSHTDGRDGVVLEDINFTTEPDQIIGIIDSMGSGRTALVQMISQLYDTTEGQVLVSGVDVRECSSKNLREGVDIVLQKNVLFSGTIEKNLRWDREDASTDKIRKMVQNIQVDSFVTSFTNSYDTDMEQSRVNISGGQKQRLCIARALLRRPEIPILGGSTSVVGMVMEAKIRQCFNTSPEDTTKIIIVQHIESVEEADRILILDKGRLISQETYEQLMGEYKAYQEIHYSQRDREETAVSRRDNGKRKTRSGTMEDMVLPKSEVPWEGEDMGRDGIWRWASEGYPGAQAPPSGVFCIV